MLNRKMIYWNSGIIPGYADILNSTFPRIVAFLLHDIFVFHFDCMEWSLVTLDHWDDESSSF